MYFNDNYLIVKDITAQTGYNILVLFPSEDKKKP